MKDNPIDKIAKQALEEYRAPFNPDDWADMEARLNKRRRVAPRLWMIKGFEILLVLLTLLTIHNIVNTHPTTASWKANEGDGVKSEESRVNSEGMNAGVAQVEGGAFGSANLSDQANQHTNTQAVALGNTGEQSNNKAGAGNASFVNKTPSGRLNNNAGVNGGNGKNAVSKGNNEHNGNTPNAGNADAVVNANAFNPSAEDSDPAIRKLFPDYFQTPSHEKEATATGLFELLDNFSSKLMAPPIEMPSLKLMAKAAPDIRKPPARKRTKQEFDFAMGFAPEATVRGKSGNFSMGYQIHSGITAYFMDRFAIETGINYSLKRFYEEKTFTLNPTDNPPFNQVLEKRQVTINTLEVPVGLRVDTYRNRHIRLYVNAGFSVHAALWNVYLKERTASGIEPDGSVLVEYQTSERLPAENGLVQGGSMGSNLYFSANVGMGIEFKANERSSLFLQPTYRHALKGIGPDNEPFHSMSLLIGFRTKLSGKR